ncbi:acyltransferase-domain-containing protein, partial [Testicularia cyperi]
RDTRRATMTGSGSPGMYTVRAVAAFSRNLLRFGCSKVHVRGLDRFVSVLTDPSRRAAGTGLLTYCNHISVLDEPTIWGCLPKELFRDPRTVRWTLGASDIMFRGKLLSDFFTNGQCIETHRGGGIFQPAIDTSIDKLDGGDWIHLFPEGYVNVSTSTRLRRFKWGIARMLLEAQTLPTVVPIWLSGFDRLMPEPRSWPNWMPRLGNEVTIHFGEPIQDQLAPAVAAVKQTGSLPIDLLPENLQSSIARIQADIENSQNSTTTTSSGSSSTAHSKSAFAAESETVEKATARSQIAALLRYHLALVGQAHRRAIGQDPLVEGTLCHQESLRPSHEHPDKVLPDGERKSAGV